MCRMYEVKPKRVKFKCLLCAYRGGTSGCKRSKNPKLVAEMQKRLEE